MLGMTEFTVVIYRDKPRGKDCLFGQKIFAKNYIQAENYAWKIAEAYPKDVEVEIT